MMRIDPKIRFWRHVNKTDTCWLWLGYIDKDGYGSFRVNEHVRAHRFSWEINYGCPIPTGLCVLHQCDIKACVNPDHLFLGTRKDNTADAVRKNRMARGERCGQAKLTEIQVRAIRLSLLPQIEIARIYNISRASICMIKKRRIWKHIKGGI
jgi:hypothetical protein